jgi:predicted kinase
MKAIITVGMSASGKSTYASEMVKQGYSEINRDWIRFNVVCPGSDWSTYKFIGKNEKEVSKIHGQLIMDAWGKMENIIISDTNLDKGRREGLITKLKDLGYEVSVMEFPITREQAIKRDNLRPNGVGGSVIYRQSLQWLDFKNRITYTPDEELPKAVIVDVDGTIAEMTDRGPFEWKKVGQDKPRQFVLDMVKSLHWDKGYKIIIVSGRSDECHNETFFWLDKHEVPFEVLYMRKEGDYRKDYAVKEEIFWTHLAHKYNIVACIDDRPMMIRLWHELKIPNVIAVANPYLEF